MTDLYLTAGRFLKALIRQRDRIKGGLALSYFDDDTPGNKSTSCSWGLCSDEKEAWPDAKDHLWPDQFIKDGRVAPKYLKPEHSCPLDAREPSKEMRSGCFYTCRIFNAPKGSKRMTREEAIRFYDIRISQND